MLSFPNWIAKVRRIGLCACLAALVPAARAGDLLAPGDIVAVGNVLDPRGAVVRCVVRIDPATGAQTVLHSNTPAYRYIAVDRDEVLYGSTGASALTGRIDRLDLATGVLSALSTGVNLFLPQGIAVDEVGDLLVVNQRTSFLPPSDAMLLRIDAGTGRQTVLAQNAFLARPKDLAFDVDGTVVVVDDTLFGGLFRFDPQTGRVTTISENQQTALIAVATFVALAPDGTIFVNGPGTNGLVRVDPRTGGQFVSLQGLSTIVSLKSSLDGDLLVARGNGSILRVDPVTETVVGTVTSNGLLLSIQNMAVVPAPVSPPHVTGTVQAGLLWPPNHQLLTVGFGVSVEHDAATTLSFEVYSDEDDSERGSGPHETDAVDVGAGTLLLRAERSGLGDGRVYLIVARAADDFGNVGFGCCTVVVPKAHDAQSLSDVQAQAAAALASFGKAGGPPAGFVRVGER